MHIGVLMYVCVCGGLQVHECVFMYMLSGVLDSAYRLCASLYPLRTLCMLNGIHYRSESELNKCVQKMRIQNLMH